MPRFLLPVAVSALCLLICLPASAQLVIGQYEDEAPLRTWNLFGVEAGQSLGLGGAQFARAWDTSVSLTNPALLLSLPRFSITITGSCTSASLFKYSLVNTGVVSSQGNLSARVYEVEFGGCSFHLGNWAFAGAAGLLEGYSRPGISILTAGSSYQLDFAQSGFLRAYQFAAARRLASRFSVGFGLNVVSGRLKRDTSEQYFQPDGVITVTDHIGENYRGLFLNGGITWEILNGLTVALVGRTPYIKKGQAQSSSRYQAPMANTDISINAEAVNEYRLPWIFGGGLSYRPGEAWTMVADLTFFDWSRYAVRFFDEPQVRRFRNVLKAAAGVEYAPNGRIFGRPAGFPIRLGLTYDPQPMPAPSSSYYYFTAGAGVRTAAVAADLSAAFGGETGSGNSLKAGKIALTLTYFLNRK